MIDVHGARRAIHDLSEIKRPSPAIRQAADFVHEHVVCAPEGHDFTECLETAKDFLEARDNDEPAELPATPTRPERPAPATKAVRRVATDDEPSPADDVELDRE